MGMQELIGKWTQTSSAVKHLFVMLALCYGTQSYAGHKLAIINDPDGFVNVRKGPGVDSPVIAVINKHDFFYCGWDQEGEWVQIFALKWLDRKQVEGFVHRSRIKLVKDLGPDEQKTILNKVLEQQRSRAEEFLTAWESKDSTAYARTSRNLGEHSDTQYSPVLEGLLHQYICLTKDTAILDLFYSTVWADRGSANEFPSFALGECFACETDLVTNRIMALKDKEQKTLLLERIHWGLLNMFEVHEDSSSKNVRYVHLKQKLDQAKASIDP